MKSFLDRLRQRPRLRLALTICGGVFVVLIGVLIAALISAGSSPEVKPKATAVAPQPVEVVAAPPTSVHLFAEFPAWEASSDAGTMVRVQGGDAPDGDVALMIDTPGAVASVIEQKAAVQPGASMDFSVWVRTGAEKPAASIALEGAEPSVIAIPATSGKWEKLTSPIIIGSDASTVTFRVTTQGAVVGLGVDGVELKDDAGATILMNASFEDYSAASQLTNESLIMNTNEAYLGVSWRSSNITWALLDSAGATLDEGAAVPANGLTLLKFGELEQGFYSVSLTMAETPNEPLRVAFMVLDPEDAATSGVLDKRFGVMIHPSSAWYSGSEVVAEALGLGAFRFATGWERDEPTEGVFDFANATEPIVKAFASRGLAPLALSGFQNHFYDENRTPSTPGGIEGFARYSSALVGHYGADSVEVWNEFNHPPFNNGRCGMTAACYMELLAPTADKVRAEHPGTLVVGPANARQDDAFLTELYKAGGLNYLDVISFHPYEEGYNAGAEFLVGNLKQAEDRIREYNNGQTKPIWITEMGWSTTLVSEAQQANNLVRAEAIAFASNVERFYWYDLVNDANHPEIAEGNFGLVRQRTDIVPSFEPKPAAMSQAVLARKLASKTFSTRDELDAASYSFVFGDGKNTTRVVWATSPTTVSYATSAPITVTTELGTVSTIEPTDGVVTIALNNDHTYYLDGELSEATVLP